MFLYYSLIINELSNKISMKNLEKYIADNKEAFDTEIPNFHIWTAIEKQLASELDLETFIKDHKADFDTQIPNLCVWAAIEKQLAPELDLEGFISENKANFDTEIPNLKIWAQIDKIINRPAERRHILRGWFLRCAAAVALLVIGATAGIFMIEKRADTLVEKQIEQVAPDFQKTEKYYNQQVQAKLTILATYQNADPSVLSDLKQIDLVQEELKAELENAPTSTREEIVRRVIDNYKIKIGILERVLENIGDNPAVNLDNKQKIKQQNDSI